MSTTSRRRSLRSTPSCAGARMKKLGIVGAGAIAQAYLTVLKDCDFARIVAVADPRAEAAGAAAEMAGARAYASHEAMGNTLDAVIVATPPATHPSIACHFLKAGVPVLCEKPLAINPAGADAILAAARASGTPFAMASKFRHSEDVIRLRSIVASGLLGDVRLIENAFAAPVDMAQRWNSDPAVAGGGVLMDNGTHSVDIVRFLAGPISEVLAVLGTARAGLGVEDNAFVLARTAGGIEARIDLSWTFDKGLANYVSVYGTQGTAHIGWRSARYRQRTSAEWIEFGRGYDKSAAFRAKVRNFLASLDGREVPLISEDDAAASVAVINAAYASAETARWTQVGAGRPAVRAA